MKFRMFALLAGFGVCVHGAQAQYVTVDFSPQFNMSRGYALLGNGATFPYGDQTYNGVPMALGGGPDVNTPWAWTAQEVSGNNPHVLTVAVGAYGVTRGYSLMNTLWGQSGPNSYLSIQFNATGGVTQTFNLVGNEDVRDYNQYIWTNSINGTSTIQVWNNGLGQRLDMQTYVLDSAFANQTLTSIVVTDTGNGNFQRSLLAGLTLEAGGAPCIGDLNYDGFVNDADFQIFAAAYNLLDCADPSMPAGCPSDLNKDGVVDDADFVIFVPAYNALVCP